jgi:hypothetical protein
MTIYDDLKSVSSELHKEFDQTEIKLIQLTPGTGPAYNPGPSTETTRTLDAVARGATFQYVQSGFAVASDIIVSAAIVDGVTPTENDFISIDGVRHKIIKDMSAPAAGMRCVWKFIVRRGG